MTLPKRKKTISAAELRRLLSYDQQTGHFRWLIVPNSRLGKRERAGSRNCRDGRVRIQISGAVYLAHRLAWLWMMGEWPPNEIDHRDGNPSNNAWCNLRAATRVENLANRRATKNNKLGIKGVTKKKDCARFVAQIKVNGRNYNLGYFKTPEEAQAAYKRAADQFFGAFARA